MQEREGLIRIDGKITSATIKDEIAAEVVLLKENNKKIPHLAAILVGNDGASQTYVGAKVKACEKVGFGSTLVRLDETEAEEELLNEVEVFLMIHHVSYQDL